MLTPQQINTPVIATFAKHMVCPDSLQQESHHNEIANIGLDDFNSFPYKHLSQNYTGKNKPCETILLEKIKEAVKNTLDPGKKPLLLLSDGKDSTAIALAMAELGISCQTLTILRNEDDGLKRDISAFATKLGHKPYFVNTKDILEAYSGKLFLNACSKMDYPIMDQAFLFYLFSVHLFFTKAAVNPNHYILLDGMGNDEYFGHIPSKAQLRSHKISSFNGWGFFRRLNNSSKWFLRSTAESHGNLSTLSCLFSFPNSFNLNKYFSKIPRFYNPLKIVDFRAFSRGSMLDTQCMMGKTIVTANSFNTKAVFPWLDNNLIEYCFNLPVSHKFDFQKLKNKLLLRSLLESKIGWRQAKRGLDLYFDLDMPSFKKQVLSQIVPDKITRAIDNSRLLPEYVKKRACLELLNFYGFCVAKGMTHREIEGLLFGNK